MLFRSASNLTSAETTQTQGLTAFGSNGFTIGTLAKLNTNTSTYVAWAWDAGSTTSTNNSGTITSTVSVNPTAGFSIVSFTSQTSGASTVGHGLGSSPKLIIAKQRNTGSNWSIYHSSLGASNYILLHTTAASVSSTTRWNNVSPTSSVFSIGTDFIGSGSDIFIAYCFSEIEGYSKFGSYTGNGSSDGPFVWCGFRPRRVMIKMSSAATTSWAIYDSARDTFNTEQNSLFADSSVAEISNSSNGVDFISNGFKIRTTNATWNSSGNTFIFAAFAESPFKYARAR